MYFVSTRSWFTIMPNFSMGQLRPFVTIWKNHPHNHFHHLFCLMSMPMFTSHPRMHKRFQPMPTIEMYLSCKSRVKNTGPFRHAIVIIPCPIRSTRGQGTGSTRAIGSPRLYRPASVVATRRCLVYPSMPHIVPTTIPVSMSPWRFQRTIGTWQVW